MSKLNKEQRLEVYNDWKLRNQSVSQIARSQKLNKQSLNYMIKLIDRYGIGIYDQPNTRFTKDFKEEAIVKALTRTKSLDDLSLDLGLRSNGILCNWIREYKKNGYNVVIKKKGRRTHEQEKAERIRAAQARKRQAASPEFKAYCRKRIYKKIGCLGSKKKEPTKTEIAQAITELRHELSN